MSIPAYLPGFLPTAPPSLRVIARSVLTGASNTANPSPQLFACDPAGQTQCSVQALQPRPHPKLATAAHRARQIAARKELGCVPRMQLLRQIDWSWRHPESLISSSWRRAVPQLIQPLLPIWGRRRRVIWLHRRLGALSRPAAGADVHNGRIVNSSPASLGGAYLA